MVAQRDLAEDVNPSELHSMPDRSTLPPIADQIWRALAEPGSRWSSRDRIALMRESRMAAECVRCERAKHSLVPVIGRGHTKATELPPEVIDLCHTLVEFPQAIDRDWYAAKTRDAVTPSSYVEAVATVAVTRAIDRFARQSGGAVFDLPQPVEGMLAPRPGGTGVEVGAWMPGAAGDQRLSNRGAGGALGGAMLKRLSLVLNVSPPSLAAVDASVELLESSGDHTSTHAFLSRLAVAVGIAPPSVLSEPVPGAVRRLLRRLLA